MKKSLFNRVTAIVLAVVIVAFGLCVANVSAESYNGFIYEIKTDYSDNSQYIIITGYEGSSSEPEVPSEIDGLPVTKIGYGAFNNNETITSVTVPDSVKVIEGSAFRNCTNLTAISLPDSLEEIGWSILGNTAYAQANTANGMLYYNNYLISAISYEIPAEITVKDGTVLIADSAFSYAEITSVSLPDSLKYIGSDAFYGCELLTSVDIPDGVQSIDSYAFSYCTGLKSVDVPDSVVSLGSSAFSGCSSLTSAEIPASITVYPSSLFRGCESLTEFEIKDTVTDLGSLTFAETGIKSIHIPAAVNYVDGSIFALCSELSEITVDPANENYYTENNILYKKITYMENSDKLIRYPINGETGFVFPDKVYSADTYAFSGNSDLKEITINNQMYSFGIDGCLSLENIYVDAANENFMAMDGVLYSKDGTILYCYPPAKSDSSLTVNDAVTTIDYYAIYKNPYLTSITIPATVTEMGSSAISYCDNLTEVNLNTVTGIDSYAINGCYNLKAINFAGTTADWEAVNMHFSSTECDGLYIYCTDGTIEAVPPKPTEPATTEATEPESTATEPESTSTEPVDTSGTDATEPDDIPTVPVTTEPSELGFEVGDVNMDTKINIKDATTIQKYCAKLAEFTDEQMILADYNLDSKINVKDATQIQKKLANLI